MSEIIKGRLLAEKVREKTAARIQKFEHPPGLAAILVGNDTASHLYVRLKEEAAREVGIYFEKIEYPSDTPTKEIIRRVHELNRRNDINGILVQLPLPDQDEDDIISAIYPEKDVDGFHIENRNKLENGESGLVSPVALAVMKLIDATRQPLRGKRAVIISNHQVFAEPLINTMKDAGIEAHFVPRIAGALNAKIRTADIIVVAVGEPDFINADMVKEGAIVIDVGTNKVDGKIVGDVAREVRSKAGFVSPSPGGVGPLTVAYLLSNVVRAAQIQKENNIQNS